MTERRSQALRCLESAAEETGVYTLGNHSVLPSPQEVDLWVRPTCLSGWALAGCVCVLCWAPGP